MGIVPPNVIERYRGGYEAQCLLLLQPARRDAVVAAVVCPGILVLPSADDLQGVVRGGEGQIAEEGLPGGPVADILNHLVGIAACGIEVVGQRACLFPVLHIEGYGFFRIAQGKRVGEMPGSKCHLPAMQV